MTANMFPQKFFGSAVNGVPDNDMTLFQQQQKALNSVVESIFLVNTMNGGNAIELKNITFSGGDIDCKIVGRTPELEKRFYAALEENLSSFGLVRNDDLQCDCEY